jgi:hypothetical protein
MVRCCQSSTEQSFVCGIYSLLDQNRSLFILYINPYVFRSLSTTFIQEDSVMAQVVDCRFAGESRT